MVRASFALSGTFRMKPVKDPFLCVPRSLGVCLYRLPYYKFGFYVVNIYFSNYIPGDFYTEDITRPVPIPEGD